MRQLRNKWLVVLPILAISTMAFGQVFHPAVGAGTYGNPYGWLGNSGANAWEQYRMGTGTTTTLLPTDLPIQATNVVGNNTRVDYSWLVQSYPAGCGGGSAELNALNPLYKPSVNQIGALVGMTSAASDPDNMIYLTGSSDTFTQRWTAGQLDITVAFMENPAAWLTKVGGDTGNVDLFGSPDANGRGTDMVIMRWETKLTQTPHFGNFTGVNSSRSVDIPGTNTSTTNSANLTEHHADSAGHTGTTAKRYFTGTDANNDPGAQSNSWSIGITPSTYVKDPNVDDANQCDPTWPLNDPNGGGNPAPYGPNAEENPYSSDAPIEISMKLYQTDGSPANGGTDKFAPNTGDGNDWSNNDVIFQTKFGATAFSRKIDINDPNNPDAIDWDGGTFDWANAKPVITINGTWSWMPTRVEMGVVKTGGGDVNTDGQTEFADLLAVIAVANYNQVDTSLATGDTTQDGQTEFADLLAVIAVANYNTVVTGPEAGEVELVVDYTTGEVWLDANSVSAMNAYSIHSDLGDIVPGNHSNPFSWMAAGALTGYDLDMFTTSPSAKDGLYSLGLIYNTSNDNRDLEFYWGDGTPTQIEGYVTYVPEPATLSLLVLGGIGVLLRRRR